MVLKDPLSARTREFKSPPRRIFIHSMEMFINNFSDRTVMKLYLNFLVLCSIFIFGISCVVQSDKPENTQAVQNKTVIADELPEPLNINASAAAENANITLTNTSTENKTKQQEQTPPEDVVTQTTTPEQKLTITYPDTFDSTSIDTLKYSVLIKGPGSILQNNKIISSGNASNEIVWNIFYPNEKIDFTKDFAVTVDVNLTAEVERGDAMAILAMEPLDKIQNAEMPERNYCEISTGSSHGTMIRTVKSGHGNQLTKTVGKMKISFNALKEEFTCGLDNIEQSYEKKIEFGDYRLTLRGGIHNIGSGLEKPGTGSFTVTYDNLDIVVKKD